MNKNLKMLTLFFSITFILSCKKNEVAAPASPVSTEEQNTEIAAGIRARVNESYFSSTVNRTDTITSQPAPFYATYGSDSTSLIILGDGNINQQDSVSWAQMLLWVTRFNGEDTYPIEDGSSLAVFSVVDTLHNLRQFISSGSPNGSVIINQFDTVNNTISGSFEFTALSNDSVVIIKNGVFNSVKIN